MCSALTNGPAPLRGRRHPPHPSEAQHGRRSWEFLWTVRFHLRTTSPARAEERLTFDLQPVRIGLFGAAPSGYTRHGRQGGGRGV